MNARKYLLQDWAANPGDARARFILIFFRAAALTRERGEKTVLSVAVGALYRLIVTYLLGVELPWKTEVGPRLRLYHGVGLVVNDATQIGSDVVLRHCVTIGHTRPGGHCPVIEDRVEFGANSVALGGIRIGAGARIGAGSVVLHDVEPNTTVVGNPAQPVR